MLQQFEDFRPVKILQILPSIIVHLMLTDIVAPQRLRLLFRRSHSASADRGKNRYKRGEKFSEIKRRMMFFCNRVVLSSELLLELAVLK